MSPDKSLLETLRALSESLALVTKEVIAARRQIDAEFTWWIITSKETPPYALSDSMNGKSYKTKAAASSVCGNPGLRGTVVAITDDASTSGDAAAAAVNPTTSTDSR